MTNDLISREALKKDIEENAIELGGVLAIEVVCVKALIDNAPTVEQFDDTELQRAIGYSDGYLKGKEERPQGEWVVDKNSVFVDSMKCSNCNKGAEWLDGGSQFLSNFCPNCGAEMRGGKEK